MVSRMIFLSSAVCASRSLSCSSYALRCSGASWLRICCWFDSRRRFSTALSMVFGMESSLLCRVEILPKCGCMSEIIFIRSARETSGTLAAPPEVCWPSVTPPPLAAAGRAGRQL